MIRRTFLQIAGAAPLAASEPCSYFTNWPSLEGLISTGDTEVDEAARLAIRTLKLNVSEKWGRLCPVAAPAWQSHYPAWIHPFDNFWMNKVTPYLYPRDQVEWPVLLFQQYQRPTGMIGWGIHDIDAPGRFLAELEKSGKVQAESAGSRYIRDHLYVLQVHDIWRHYGDDEWARRMLPSCRKAFDYLYSMKDLDHDGLIESASILEDIDIGSTKTRTGPNAAERFVDQALLYGALLGFAQMAEATGDSAGAAQARERAAALKEKCNRLFWNEKGYYTFGIDATTHQPLPIESASTYANGYAMLYGLVPEARIGKLLDYLTSWDFVVPGPVLIPPIHAKTSIGHKEVDLKMGVYANGGCGWGRGHMPSVCLALYRHGRPSIANGYIRKLAKAALGSGAFYEYWTWEKYTGSTQPGGCRDYSETSSGFLDGLIHGCFGATAAAPGWSKVRVAPHPLTDGPCSLHLPLPGGSFRIALGKEGGKWGAEIRSESRREVEVTLPEQAQRAIVVEAGQSVRM